MPLRSVHHLRPRAARALALASALAGALAAPCSAQHAPNDSVAPIARDAAPIDGAPTLAEPLAVAPDAFGVWRLRADSSSGDTTGAAPRRAKSRVRNALGGAAIGLGAGAVSGFVLGVAAQCSVMSVYGGDCVDSMNAGFAGAVVFAGVGMVTGAVLGALRPIRAERQSAMPATRLHLAPGRGGRWRVGATVPLGGTRRSAATGR